MLTGIYSLSSAEKELFVFVAPLRCKLVIHHSVAPQFAPSTPEVSSPSSASTTSARYTRWRPSAVRYTSPSSRQVSPPRARASSPCNYGHPSGGRSCPCWTTTIGTSLSFSTTPIGVSFAVGFLSVFVSPLFWWQVLVSSWRWYLGVPGL